MAIAVGRARPARALNALVPLALGLAAAWVGIQLATNSPFAAGPQLVLVGLLIALSAWMATTRHALWALAAVLLYMGLLDGVLKLRSANELPTLGRDVLLYAAVGGLAVRAVLRGERLVLPAFSGWAIAWTVMVLAQLAHPMNGTWLHSVASLRQHIEFVPLFFVAYFLMREHRHLQNFLALLLAVAAINGLVGIYQSGMSVEALSAWGPGYANLFDPEASGGAPRTAADEDGVKRVRPPGLGSDMGFAGVLGATAIPGGLALLMLRRRSLTVRLLVVLGLLASAAGVLTSQSRASVLTVLVTLVAFVGLLAAGGYVKRSLTSIMAIGVTAFAAVSLIGAIDENAFFRYQSIAPDKVLDTTVESRSGTWSQLGEYVVEIPFGAGIGSVGPAAGQFDKRPVIYNAESQFNFLMVEVGLAGLLLFLVFQLSLFRALVRGMRRARDPKTVVLMAGIGAPLLGYAVNWLVGVNTVSTPNAPFLWVATGLIAWWLVEHPRRELSALQGSVGR
jgi:hypothetical protein